MYYYFKIKYYIVDIKILLTSKKKNKKTNQKDHKKNTIKWPGPKQLVQDGTLVKLNKGHLGYLLTNFMRKKTLFSCNVPNHGEIKRQLCKMN